MVDGVTCMRNSAAVDIGTLVQDVAGVCGWALIGPVSPIAWGALVDGDGQAIARDFVVGDELTFPVGALRLGIA